MEVKVTLTLLEEALGMSPSDPKVQEKYISSFAPDAKSAREEVEQYGVDFVVEKGKTVFPKENGVPFLYDYQIKGMFKDSCGMLRMVQGTESEKLKAYKKRIDGLVFVEPRKILIDTRGGKIGDCQRPLRAMTMQGERVSLANSETIPAGSTLSFTVRLLDPGLMDAVVEWLEYGKIRGLGQWRNSGKGKFSYHIDGIEDGGKEI